MAAYLKRLFILSVCVVCLLSTNAFPQSNQIPIGARPAGLGDAFIAVADDGNALYWNPAGIATLGHHEFNGMTANAFQAGVKHQFLSYILPFSSRHALGIAGFSERLSDDEIDFFPTPEIFSKTCQSALMLNIWIILSA